MNPIQPRELALIDQDIAAIEEHLKSEVIPQIANSIRSLDRAVVIAMIAGSAAAATNSDEDVIRLSASWAVATALLAEVYDKDSNPQ